MPVVGLLGVTVVLGSLLSEPQAVVKQIARRSAAKMAAWALSLRLTGSGTLV
jgi:hypothetical protein